MMPHAAFHGTPVIDRSWWTAHALATTHIAPSDTWCWFHGRRWLPQVADAPAAVASPDAAHLLRLAALLVEATHRSGAARRWLSDADRLWARRTGLAVLGATQPAAASPLALHDAVGLFDAAEQGPLRLALPRAPCGPCALPPAKQARLRRLLVLCRRYTDAPRAEPSAEDIP